MARKDEEFDLDDWGDLDANDLDFDFELTKPQIPTGRDAVLATPVSVAKGAANAIIGPGKRRDLILKALPKEYTVAADAYDNLASTGQDIYRHARDEMQKAGQQLKYAGRAVLPMAKPFLPKSIADKLAKAVAVDPTWANDYDPKEAGIQSGLDGVFGQQVSREQATAEAEDYVRDKLEDKVREVKEDRLHDVIGHIGRNVEEITSYNRSVGTSWRKKMLELSFRQYYVLSDMLKANAETSQRTVDSLEAIVKNTALPDYAKEEFGEITAAMMKRKVIDVLSPANFARNYFRVLGDNVRSKITDFFGGVGDIAGMVAMGAEMANDEQSFDDTELTPEQRRAKMAQNAARAAGGAFANKFIAPRVKKLQERARTWGENNEEVANFGGRAANLLTTLPERLNTYAMDPSYEGSEPALVRGFMRMLSTVGPQLYQERVDYAGYDAQALESAAKWSKRNDVSLNEIIPGYLARIDRSVRRIYDPNAGLEVFDFRSKDFKSLTGVAKGIHKTFANTWTKERGRKDIDAFVNELSSHDKDGILQDSDKDILRELIEARVMRPGQFDVRELASQFGAYGNKGEGQLMEFFEGLSKDRLTANAIDAKAQMLISSLRQRTGGAQSELDAATSMYSPEVLKRAKVLKENEDGSLVFNRKSMSIYGDFDEFGDDDANDIPFGNGGIGPKGPRPRGGGTPGGLGRIDAQTIRDGMRQAFWGGAPTLRDTIVSAIEMVNRKVGGEDASNAKNALGGEQLTPEKYMAEILAQLKEMNVAPRIDEIIEAIHGVSTSNVDPEKLEEYFKGKRGKIKSFFGKLWKSGKTRWRYARRTGRNLRNRAWTAVKDFTGLGEEGAVRKFFTNAKDTVVGGLTSLKDGLLGERNIYDADGNIILVGKLIKMGKYYSKDGTPIKSIKDIKGGVYTESGEPIISEEDMAKKLGELRYWSGKGWEMLTSAPGVVADKFRTAVGVAGKIQKFIRSVTTDAAKAGLNQLRTGRDVYVKDQMETPRLHRNLMVKGWYVSETTGKAIRRGSDVDGPVITKHKEPIITAQELADPNFQLVYADGSPVKSRWDELKGSAKSGVETVKNVVVGGLKMVGRGFGFAKDVGASMWEALTGKPTGKQGGMLQRFLSGQNAVTDRLDKIYDLLDDRMKGGRRRRKPGKPEDNGGDADGDGVRDNSYLDIFRRRRAAAAEKAKAKKEAEGGGEKKEGGGFFSKLLTAGGAIFTVGKTLANGFIEVAGTFFKNTFGTFLTAIGEKLAAVMALKKGADVLGDAADMAGDLGDLGGEGNGREQRRRRGGRGRGRFSRWTSRLKDGLGRFGGRAGAARAAASAGATVAGEAAMSSGFVAAGGWLLRGAVTLAVGAVTSPWTIGAIAAYGAYRILKRKAPGILDQMRFAQYGSTEYDREDLDDAAMLRYLEAQVGKYVSFDRSGVASVRGIDGPKVDEIAAGAGVDLKAEEKVGLWNAWFHGRFIPVFLLWQSRARQQAPQAKLEEIAEEGKVPFDVQVRIAENCVLDGGHPMFRIDKGPLPEDMNLLTGDRVVEIQDEVLGELKKAASLRPKSEPMVKEDQDLSKESTVAQTGDTKVDKKRGWFSEMLHGAKEALGFKDEEETPKMAGGVDVIGSSIRKSGRDVGKQLDALASVRVRAYGLFQLRTYRIEQLYRLEDYVFKYIARTNAEIKFQGDLERIANSTSNFFGIMHSDEEGKTNYANWFKTRFMPVFMSYLKAFWMRVPNGDPFQYTLNQFSGEAFDIASDIIGTKTNVGGKMVAIWAVEFSPWKRDNEYTIAAVTEAVNANMRFLDSLRKSKELAEQKEAKEGTTRPKAVASATTNKPAAKAPQMSKEEYDRSPQRMLDAVLNGDESANDPNVADGMVGGSGGVNFDYTMGAMSEFGEGSGSYAELRKQPVGDFASVANMIAAASNMAGMDPGLMLTVGMMESSLNPKAGANTSSAKGLFQFINSTWTEVLAKYGNKYGIPKNANVYDPWANTLMGAEYLKEGARRIQGVLGRPATPVDLYMTHFLGGGGGSKFLKNMAANPNRIAAADFQSQASANRPVFFKNGRALTYAEIYDALQRRARNNFSNVAQYAKGSNGGNGDVSKPLADVNDDAANIPAPANQPVPLSTDDQAAAAEQYMADKAADKATVKAKAFDNPIGTPPASTASEAATTAKAAETAAVTTNTAQAAREATESVEMAKSSVAASTKASAVATTRAVQARVAATGDIHKQQLDVQKEILHYVEMIAMRPQASSQGASPIAANSPAGTRERAPFEPPRGIIPTARG